MKTKIWHRSAIDPAIGVLTAFALWEAIVRFFAMPSIILPPPSAVIVEIWRSAILLSPHVFQTLLGTFSSLALAIVLGVLLGFAIGYSQTLSRMVYPLLGGFNALPKSAFVPILAVWFGIGFMPRLVAGFLTAFFPIVVNVVTGLRTIEPEWWDLLRSIGAKKRQIYLKVGLPRTVPYFFASLKLASAGAFIGNIVGEMLASGQGLGYVLLVATSQLNMTLAFACLLILLIVGYALFAFFTKIETVFAPWAYRATDNLVVVQKQVPGGLPL